MQDGASKLQFWVLKLGDAIRQIYTIKHNTGMLPEKLTNRTDQMMECWRRRILKDMWPGINWRKDILREYFYTPEAKKQEAGSKKQEARSIVNPYIYFTYNLDNFLLISNCNPPTPNFYTSQSCILSCHKGEAS